MTDPLTTITTSLHSISASPSLKTFLKDLHTLALTEPPYISTDDQDSSVALERFVALEPDKCAFVYLLLRSMGARYVVEAGTSFGVSTIYLALAVGQNVAGLEAAGGKGKVIATENEAVKAGRAKEHWRQAGGEEVEKWIELREGDVRETLKETLLVPEGERVDFLLLDIWSYLALPVLKLVQPHLRIGATVVADNIVAAKEGYKEFLEYIEDSRNGFRNTTLPFTGGLLVSIYMGRGAN